MQDTQEVLEWESTSRKIEHDSTTHGSVSSVDNCQGDFLRTDRNQIGDNENVTTTNGSVKIEDECENTTVEDSLEHEQNMDDGSADTEEWNCTIQ